MMIEKKMSRSEILDEAKKCICGQRQQDYGEIEDNFSCIADLWTAFKGVKFTAREVAIMMTLLKVARMRKPGHIDSAIDAAGYCACAGQLESNEIVNETIDRINEVDNINCNQYIDANGEVYISYNEKTRG